MFQYFSKSISDFLVSQMFPYLLIALSIPCLNFRFMPINNVEPMSNTEHIR